MDWGKSGEAEIVREHEYIETLARKASRSRTLREEIVQETWLELLERPPKDRGGIRAWLKIVVRHAAIRIGRRERERALREREAARSEHEPSADELAERAALRRHVVERVLSLAEPYRTVVRLRYLEGESLEDIAARTGRSQGTVRSQLKRGLDRLRAGSRDGTWRRSWILIVPPVLRRFVEPARG